jgi:hypothetical protein
MRLLTALTLLATLAVASSCSSKEDATVPSAAETPPAVSGTRLRAKLVVAGDSREHVGFYDLERKEDCTFQRTADERMRCLPAWIPYQPNGVFSDPACQNATGSLPTATCGDAPKYVMTFESGNGCGVSKPAGLRTVVDAASPRYVRGPAGCTLQPASSSAPPVVAVGDAVPLSAFVEAVETVIPGGSVAETVLSATDGARQHLGFRSETLGADCTFQIMADGETRCLPEGRTGPVMYSDSACTTASFVIDYESSGSCTERTKFWLARQPATASCRAVRAVYSLRASTGSSSEDAYSEGDAEADGSSTCNSNESGQYGGRRAIDADLTSSLAIAKRIGSGSGRLVPALIAQPGTSSLVRGWHDNERNVDCSFTLASDGKTRCLPAGGFATIFFTDTACKSPSRVVVSTESSCFPMASPFARVTSTTCPPTTRVFALGTARRSLPEASTETGPGRCARVAGLSNAFDATETDPSGFVEGTPLTE